MTQRNPLNDRYNTVDEKRTGKTRKSSASAKPKAQRAATVRDPAPKTKKQKKEEARERERKAAQKASVVQARFEETETYKRLRRTWWVLLGAAVLCTIMSFVIQGNESMRNASIVVMVMAYGFIISAFWIDLGKIRKERRLYNEALANNKSKEARKEQKKLRAEMREQEKEAAEKYEAAKAEEATKAEKRKGLFGLFGKGKEESGAKDAPTSDASAADASEKADAEGAKNK